MEEGNKGGIDKKSEPIEQLYCRRKRYIENQYTEYSVFAGAMINAETEGSRISVHMCGSWRDIHMHAIDRPARSLKGGS